MSAELNSRLRGGGSALRLGRVEIAILDALSRSGGLTQRDEAMQRAFPALRAAGATVADPMSPQDRLRRARAEAALSRAIVSLERKGLLVRERNVRTGRTLLRTAGDVKLPEWEEMARAEEDLAAHCRRVAGTWRALARRALQRAEAVRAERSADATEGERSADLAEINQLQGEQP
jgi:DNA-binding MarR family transcriptional regulator